MTAPIEALETVTCSRCAGTGHYSYCPMYGTRCFKCHGRKVVYTKRGAAARAYLETIRSKRAADLAPGDVVWSPGVPGFSKGRWVTITAVRVGSELKARINGVPVDASAMVDYEATDKTGLDYHSIGNAPDSMVRVAQSPEAQRETMAAALAYQATLTKAGTPRKRAARRVHKE